MPAAARAGVTSVPAVADLQAGITSADSPLNGQPLVYTLTAKNNGPDNEGMVQLTQTLPTNATYSSADPDCTHDTNAGTVTCMKTGLPNGATATFHVTVTPNQAGPISSEVNVSGDAIDENPTNDSAPGNATVAPAADLSITKTHSPSQAFRGENLTYTLKATNAGPDPATNVVVSDPLPSGVDLVTPLPTGCTSATTQGATTVTCTATSLAKDASQPFAITVKPNRSGSLSNTASVGSATADPTGTPAQNSATDETTVGQRDTALSVSITHSPDHPGLGEDITYVVAVANGGPDTAQGVRVTDVLPAELTLTDAPGCTNNADTRTVTCRQASLAGGDKTFFKIHAKANKAGSLTSVATVTSDSNDLSDSDSDTVNAEATADLSLTGTVSSERSPIRTGDSFNFVLTVKNHGQDTATGVTVTDTLPAGLTFQPGPGCTATGQVVKCTASSLAKDDTTVFNVSVKASKSGTYTDDASVTSNATDEVLTNNSDSSDASVVSVVDLTLSVSHVPANPVVGGELEYTFAVHNNGAGSAAENVKVSDPLPAGASFVKADQGCALESGTVTCSPGTLADNTNATFHVTLRPTKAGELDNTVTATANDAFGTPDADPSNNSATDTAVVAPAPVAAPSADLGIRVSRDAPRLVRGVEAIYTLGAVNHGPSAASGVSLTATLPSNVTFVSASSGCKRSGAKVTCTIGSLASGARASRSIRVRPNRTGTTSTSATISSSVRDPDASDNTDADTAYVEEPSASRGRLIVCRVGRSGSVCTVRYDGKGRPKVTGSLRRGTRTYVSGSTRSGRPLRLNSRRRIGEGKYTLVRTYNGRRITFDAVYVVVVR